MMHNPPHPGLLLDDYLGDVSIAEAARRLGVTRATLSRIEADTAHIFDPAQDKAPVVVPATTVVLVGFNQPNNELREELDTFAGSVHVIGDCLSPRFIEAAISEGYHAGLAI